MAKYKELNFDQVHDVELFLEELEGKTRPIVIQVRFEDFDGSDASEVYIVPPKSVGDFLGDVFGSEFESPDDEGASIYWAYLQ